MQATPRLSEDKVRQCVDPKLGVDYPPKAVAKVKTKEKIKNTMILYVYQAMQTLMFNYSLQLLLNIILFQLHRTQRSLFKTHVLVKPQQSFVMLEVDLKRIILFHIHRNAH